ncbi:MAG TPA: helix-turn-helix domain-containing protein [Pseudorhizobium sp.]|jgi:CRP/FNR family transcriptional regulator|nr:helix-turn-helix domain-containing protein [Pseudorhizobium sp.]
MFAQATTKSAFATPAPVSSQQTDCLHTLFAKQPVEHLSAAQILFFQGDAAASIFEIVQGTLRIMRILPDGRRVITGFLHAGDILGISFKSHYIYSAEAINDVVVRRLSRKAFEKEVASSDELRPAVFHRMSDEMAAAQDQMVLLSTKNAEERLCSFLLVELQRALRAGAREAVVRLPMTRLDIADYLGLTIETVSRTMTKLANKGVLAASGRHAVKILRRTLLAQLAGDGDEWDEDRRSAYGSAEERRAH